MKRICVLLIALTSAAFTVSAQEQNASSRSITNLSVSSAVSEDGNSRSITLSWNKSTHDQARFVYIYRSGAQIFGSAVSTLTPAAKLPIQTVTWTDTPPAEGLWYYAVLSAAENGSLLDIVIPTVNATIAGFSSEVPKQPPVPSGAAKRPAVSSRSERTLIPLPFLNMEKESAKPAVLSKEAVTYAEDMSRMPRQLQVMPLFVFPEEKAVGGTGEQYLLSEIISTYFVQNDWDRAESELKKFLQINRSPDITRRAKFYLGQVYYYQGYYRESLYVIIEAEDIFPSKTKQWITAVLQKMPL